MQKKIGYNKEGMAEKQQAFYDIGRDESDRIQFMKLIFCIMVVFIHSYTTEVHFADNIIAINFIEPVWVRQIEYTITEKISICAVPAFFFLSAVMLYRKEFLWSANVKRKIRSLLVPYFILNTFWIVFFGSLQQIKLLSMFFRSYHYVLAQWDMARWLDVYLGIFTGRPILGPLWFVRDLFFLNVIAKVLKQIIDRFPKLWLMFIAVILFCNIDLHVFCMSSEALAFFTLGYYAVKYDIHLKDLDRINAVLVGAAYAASIAVNYLTAGTQMFYVARVLTVVMGMVFFGRISSYFVEWKHKEKMLGIARYNFGIYLFHELNLTMLKKIWFKVFQSVAFCQAAAYFVLPVIVISYCLVLCKIMERFMPGLYKILMGSRA